MGSGELGRFSLEFSPVTTYAFGRLIPSVRTFEQSTNKKDIYANLEISGHDVLVVPELRFNLQYDLLIKEKFRLGLMGGGILGYGLGSGVDNPFLEFGWQAGPRLTVQLAKHFDLGIDLLYAGRHIKGLDNEFNYTMHGFTGGLNAIFPLNAKSRDAALVLMYGYSGFFNQAFDGFESSHDVGLAFRISFGGEKKEEEVVTPDVNLKAQLGEGWGLVRKVEQIKNEEWLDQYANELAFDNEISSSLRLDAINNALLWLTSGYPEYDAKLSKNPFEKVELEDSMTMPWKGLPSLRDCLAVIYRIVDDCPNKTEAAKLLRGGRKVVSDIYHFLVNQLEKEQKRIKEMGAQLKEAIESGKGSVEIDIKFTQYKIEVQKYNAVIGRAEHVFAFLNFDQAYYFVGAEDVFDGEKSHLNKQVPEGWCLKSGQTMPTHNCETPEISIKAIEKLLMELEKDKGEPE